MTKEQNDMDKPRMVRSNDSHISITLQQVVGELQTTVNQSTTKLHQLGGELAIAKLHQAGAEMSDEKLYHFGRELFETKLYQAGKDCVTVHWNIIGYLNDNKTIHDERYKRIPKRG